MTHERWLLDRAMALLEVLMRERNQERRLTLPPGGASLVEIERTALVQALDRCHGVQSYAASLLRITPRVMQYKVVKFELHDEGFGVRRGGGGRRKGAFKKLVPRRPGNELSRQGSGSSELKETVG